MGSLLPIQSSIGIDFDSSRVDTLFAEALAEAFVREKSEEISMGSAAL